MALATALTVAGLVMTIEAASPAMAITGGGPHPVWVVQPTPNPHVVKPHPYMTDVSCATATACMAIGNYPQPFIFAERWDGTAWHVQTLPTPVGGIAPTLYGVSCSAANACTAVGYYAVASTSELVTLAERWNGSTWAVQPTPNAPGSGTSILSSVSCTSATVCTAVGGSFAGTGSPIVTLAEQWNGSAWAIQPTPNPGGSTDSELNDVSCTSATACSAVGFHQYSKSVYVTLAEQWNGSTWAIQSTPNPAGAPFSSLDALSCTSATECTAVGGYNNASSNTFTLAERWNGSTWAIQSTPHPGGSAGLRDVSCISATECTAVASYTSASTGQSANAAEQWNGSTWVIQSTPNTVGPATLRGVSCTSGPKCTAVGTQYVGTAQLPLAERYS